MQNDPSVINDSEETTTVIKLSPLKQSVAQRKRKKQMKAVNKTMHRSNNKKANWQDITKVTEDLIGILDQYRQLSSQISLFISTTTDIKIPESLSSNLTILDNDIATYTEKLNAAIATCTITSGTVKEADITDYLVIYENLTTLGTDIISVIQPTAEQIFSEYTVCSELTTGNNNE